MSKACLTCAQDPKNPCYGILIEFTTPIGSVITETDTVKILTEATVSSTGLVEVVPYISQNSSGGYYYKFSIIIDREVKNFVIYKSNSFWTVAQQDSPNSVTYTTYSTTPVTNISLECIFEDITESAIWTNVQADNVIPNLNISSVKRAILVTPSNNTTSCEPPIDTRFYWDTDLPKALEDKLEEDGSTTKGLKSNFKAQVKDTANKLLANTDWYVIRKAERSVDIPTDIADQRSAIVTEANRLDSEIDLVDSVEGLIAILNNQAWS